MFDLDTLRADFKTVFAHWRRMGELTESECRQQMAESGAAISQMTTPMLEQTAEYFASLASQVRADEAKSRSIAKDVKASRRKTA